jgi:hypothetical protein
MSRMRAVQVNSANGPFEVVERDVPEPTARHVQQPYLLAGAGFGRRSNWDIYRLTRAHYARA